MLTLAAVSFEHVVTLPLIVLLVLGLEAARAGLAHEGVGDTHRPAAVRGLGVGRLRRPRGGDSLRHAGEGGYGRAGQRTGTCAARVARVARTRGLAARLA